MVRLGRGNEIDYVRGGEEYVEGGGEIFERISDSEDQFVRHSREIRFQTGRSSQYHSPRTLNRSIDLNDVLE